MHTALLVRSSAIGEHPLWSPDSSRIAVNVEGRWNRHLPAPLVAQRPEALVLDLGGPWRYSSLSRVWVFFAVEARERRFGGVAAGSTVGSGVRVVIAAPPSRGFRGTRNLQKQSRRTGVPMQEENPAVQADGFGRVAEKH